MKFTLSTLALALASSSLTAAATLKRQSNGLPTTPVRAPGLTHGGESSLCNRWDFVEFGSTCELFIAKYPGLTLADLQAWNSIQPGNHECYLKGYYYLCTSIVGFDPTIPEPPTTTTDPTPPATISPYDPGETEFPEEGTIVRQRPSFIQAGQPVDCESWYVVKPFDRCDTLTWSLGLSYEAFEALNPALGKNCERLWQGYGYCIGTIRNPYVATPTPTGGPTLDGTPLPTQTGMVKGCKRFVKVEENDSCEYIVTRTGAESVEKLVEWNPALSPVCTEKLWQQYYICIEA